METNLALYWSVNLIGGSVCQMLIVRVIKKITEVAGMYQVEVDKDKCVGDEECVNACPAQVYEMVDGKSEPVNMDECLGCETCVEVCPTGAITVTEV